jgi:hypothetical protein
MAQLAIAAAGAVAGNAFGWGITALGMSGAAVGWTIGSLVGSAFAPSTKSQGPRIDDLKVTGTDYGDTIPWVAGAPRIAGQIVWASNRRELATTKKVGGKGGGKGKVTTYTYEVDLLILLTENEISGVSRIWSNGKLIYGDGPFDSSVWKRLAVYTGSGTQMPDPTYEAAVGTANAVAYRGRGYVFIEGLQLGQSGQIPNLTFEVGVSTIRREILEIGFLNQFNTVQSDAIIPSDVGPNLRRWSGSGGFALNTVPGVSTDFGNAVPISLNFGSDKISTENQGNIVLDLSNNKLWRIECWIKFTFAIHTVFTLDGTYRLSISFARPMGQPRQWIGAVRDRWGNSVSGFPIYTGSAGWAFPDTAGGALQDKFFHIVVQQCSDGTLALYFDGFFIGNVHGGWSFLYQTTWSFTGNAFSKIDFTDSGGIMDSTVYREIHPLEEYPRLPPILLDPLDPDSRQRSYTIPTQPHSLTDSIFEYQNVSGNTFSQQLYYTIENIIEKSMGIDEVNINESILNQEVKALAISQVSPARNTLEILQKAYFFDAVSSDKIYIKPKATAVTATIPWSELYFDKDTPIKLIVKNEQETPSNIVVQYNNILADYQPGVETADRVSNSGDNETVIQLPLGLTPDEARTIASRTIAELLPQIVKLTVRVPVKYAYVEPTDIILIGNAEANRFYRVKVDKRNDDQGYLEFQCTLDAEGTMEIEVTSDSNYEESVLQVIEDTDFEILDIPAIRDVDINLGYYCCATGNGEPTDVWYGAELLQSFDDIEYESIETFTKEGIIGVTESILGNWTKNTFDELNSVVVNIGYQELSSATRDEILNNQAINLCLIGDEILQFRSAVLISEGVYRLSGFIRARRATEQHTATHAIAERFVLLNIADLVRPSIENHQVGLPQYLKAVSYNKNEQDVLAVEFTPAIKSLMPFNPVHLRLAKYSDRLDLTWVRRTRKQYKYVGTAGFIIPQDELNILYRVQVFDSAELRRTITVSTEFFSYTQAMQTEDGFATNDTVIFKVNQINEVVNTAFESEIQGVI